MRIGLALLVLPVPVAPRHLLLLLPPQVLLAMLAMLAMLRWEWS
jgi:hypothetical protein